MELRTFSFVVFGYVLGISVTSLIMISNDTFPADFLEASAPALESVGQTTVGASALKRALNPCITSNRAPVVCDQFIKDGVITQPPIKIVIDESKIK